MRGQGTGGAHPKRTRKTIMQIENFDYQNLVKCPICNYEYCHPVEIYVNAGGVITIINSKGTRITDGEITGRGVIYGIKYFCESGHSFWEKFQFHKGNTYKEIKINDSTFNSDTVIWRS